MPTLTSIKTSVAKFIYYIEIADRLFNNTLNEMNIFAFAANNEENETYTYNSMLQQTDKENFLKLWEKK